MRKRFVCVLLILVLSLALLPTTAFADEDIVVTKENFPDARVLHRVEAP